MCLSLAIMKGKWFIRNLQWCHFLLYHLIYKIVYTSDYKSAKIRKVYVNSYTEYNYAPNLAFLKTWTLVMRHLPKLENTKCICKSLIIWCMYIITANFGWTRKIAELDDKERRGVIFPQKIITVKKKNPFMVIFLHKDKGEDYDEVYPPVKKKKSSRKPIL